uniref:EF-hand domain-containing protein n=1 Tax=Ciona savignyi TaxID=51511 RepID=H2YV23_CIOSA
METSYTLAALVLFVLIFKSTNGQANIAEQMDPSLDHNKAHLKEDLEGVIEKSPDEMNMNELQFHYFRQHDYDNDETLDGNEIVSSILHHAESSEDSAEHTDYRKFTDDQLATIIDDVLRYQDRNNDGKLDFHEYITPFQNTESQD